MADNLVAGMVQLWVNIGLYDVILPFLFMFTIVYATLDKTKILGSYKNINAMVAFCIGFITAASVSTVTAINTFFAATGFLMVAGLCIMILASMFGITTIAGKGKKWYDTMPRIIIIVIIGVALIYMLSIAFGFERWLVALIPNITPTIVQTVVVGAVFVLIMWFIVGGKSSGSSAGSSTSGSHSSGSDETKQPERSSGANSEKKDVSSEASPQAGNTLIDSGKFGKKSFKKKY